MRVAYAALPIAVIAALLRLFVSQRTDFGLVLVLVTALSGLIWLVDSLVLRRRRQRLFGPRPLSLQKDQAWPPEPATLDYARSFFPVAAVLLIVRSFLFEPYRIPSDSMMPTLQAGDFIVVNKYAYGMRLPVTQHKILSIGAPQRGDVAVFRYPVDPGINFIKRVVGLPGDRVEVRSDRLIINGEPVPFREAGFYSDGCYVNMQRAIEKLGDREHQVLHCLTSQGHEIPRGLPQCNRPNLEANYYCRPGLLPGERDLGDSALRGPAVLVVPPGHYLMIGDNRDNSSDGRYWGFVPEHYLVGKATRIWLNVDLARPGQRVQWRRLGTAIQ
ncbi:MAG: signal peptidase I [Steroidobacteraceae bacterium]|nr:signal peptidase I [Steroidobacteraceae bacterium]